MSAWDTAAEDTGINVPRNHDRNTNFNDRYPPFGPRDNGWTKQFHERSYHRPCNRTNDYERPPRRPGNTIEDPRQKNLSRYWDDEPSDPRQNVSHEFDQEWPNGECSRESFHYNNLREGSGDGPSILRNQNENEGTSQGIDCDIQRNGRDSFNESNGGYGEMQKGPSYSPFFPQPLEQNRPNPTPLSDRASNISSFNNQNAISQSSPSVRNETGLISSHSFQDQIGRSSFSKVNSSYENGRRATSPLFQHHHENRKDQNQYRSSSMTSNRPFSSNHHQPPSNLIHAHRRSEGQSSFVGLHSSNENRTVIYRGQNAISSTVENVENPYTCIDGDDEHHIRKRLRSKRRRSLSPNQASFSTPNIRQRLDEQVEEGEVVGMTDGEVERQEPALRPRISYDTDDHIPHMSIANSSFPSVLSERTYEAKSKAPVENTVTQQSETNSTSSSSSSSSDISSSSSSHNQEEMQTDDDESLESVKVVQQQEPVQDKRKYMLNITIELTPVRKRVHTDGFVYQGRPYSCQTVPCTHRIVQEKGLSKCKACFTSSDDSACLFKNLRSFPIDSAKNQSNHCIFVPSSKAEQNVELPSHQDLNRPMDFATKMETMYECANALLPVMQEALIHARQDGLLKRRREVKYRITCDFCGTGIFISSYFCGKCGQEFCLSCRNTLVSEGNDESTADMRECTSEVGNIASTHNAQDMIPTSNFTVQELEQEVRDMEGIINSSRLLGLTSQTGFVSETSSEDEEICDEGDREGNADGVVPSHKVIYFNKDTFVENQFVSLWKEGFPVVIKGVTFQTNWTPEELSKHYGTMQCTVVRCDEDIDKNQQESTLEVEKIEKKVEVKDFFRTFKQAWSTRQRSFGKGRWKLKDWPPADEMRESFPDIYDDFNESIPLPDFTRRDGCKNLSSLFAKNANAPDLGPKMYNAWPGDHKKGGQGTTKLHMDIADAVNVLLYASDKTGIIDGPIPGAQWDIFRAEDSDVIRQFLREQCDADKDEDPIHSQNFYLDDDLLQRLFVEKGIYSWRIIQRQGEAVFIPAGCAHQVCNLTDCIKIAVDFLSPQHIQRCFTLTKEFRSVAGKNVRSWKEDVLQLQTQLWYAWCTCKHLSTAM